MKTSNRLSLGLRQPPPIPAPKKPFVPLPSRVRLRFPRPTWEIALLLLVGTLALGLRLWPLQIAHWWDETAYLQNAEALFFGKTNYSELNFRPPLLSVLFGLAFLGWHSVLAASIVVALLNTLGVLFLAGAAGVLYGRTAGVVAGALLGLSPFLAETSRTLMTDNPSMSFLAMALYFIVSGERNESLGKFAVGGIFLGAAALTRFTALPALLLFLLMIWHGQRRWHRLAAWVLGLGVSLGPYLVWAHLWFGSWLATLRKASQQVGDFNEGYLFYGRSLPAVFSWAILLGFGMWLLGGIVRLGVARVGDGWTLTLHPVRSFSELRIDFLLCLWIILFLGYLTYLPHKELRYSIPVAIPMTLLAARGWTAFMRPARLRVIAIALLAGMLVWTSAPAWGRFRQDFLNTYVTEEMLAASFLNRLERTGSPVLYVNYNFPVFGYYTDLPIRILEPTDSGFYQAFPRNMPASGYAVLYKQGGRQPTPEWADQNTPFRRVHEFPSLVIYAYSKP